MDNNISHILIVDDEREARTGTIRSIKDLHLNCKIVEARSVVEAEEMVRGQLVPFDLAVIDQEFDPPKIGKEGGAQGLDLVGKIRRMFKICPQIRIVVYTGYPSLENACVAYENGADAYLGKGDPKKFQEKVKQLLTMSDIRMELDKQSVAQREAEELAQQNRVEWCEKYAGQVLLIRHGKVEKNSADRAKALEFLKSQPDEAIYEFGIIAIPAKEGAGANVQR